MTFALAEVKTFEVSVEEAVSRNQSQEAVEAFALQKAKRLAVEQAGTYLSTMKVVEKGRLNKAEVTALASGIVSTEVVNSERRLKNGQFFVFVTAKVTVDTSVLEKQVKALLKDRTLLKELEAKDKQMRALEDELAQVKGAEIERLRKLNAQAVALEMEREKQRLFLEEQRLKAQGDMAKAELSRLAEERERAALFEQLRKEQEATRQKELAAIAIEKDRIKKAQLENQANAAELARTAELARAKWVAIDDRLSAEQAKAEAESIRAEFARLLKKLDNQHERAVKNLKTAYNNQISATKPVLPTNPAAKDPFETTAEYNQRMTEHGRKTDAAKAANAKKIEQLKHKERIKLAELKVQSSESKLELLKPFAERLSNLQQKVFVLPGDKVTTEIQAPEPDNSRFPLVLDFNGKTYQTYWNYTDRDKARLFYQTRSHLVAEPLFNLEPGIGNKVDYIFTGARVTHPGTNEKREFSLLSPNTFGEIGALSRLKKKLYLERYFSTEKVLWHITGNEGNFISYGNGIVEDTRTGLEWLSGPAHTNYRGAHRWANRLNIANKAGGCWRLPTISELNSLIENSGRTPSLLGIDGEKVWSDENNGAYVIYIDFKDGIRDGYRSGMGKHYQRLKAIAVRSLRHCGTFYKEM